MSKKKIEEKPKKEELTNCPRCGRKMSWLETEDGGQIKWCYWEQAPLLDPRINLNN